MDQAEPETEEVILQTPGGRKSFFAPIPAKATLHTVPNRKSIDEDIRGRSFRRMNWIDRPTGLAIFLPQTR